MVNKWQPLLLACFYAGVSASGVNAVEVSFVPVSATGPYQIIAPNIIYVPQGGQQITFDFFVANWDPDQNGSPLLKVIQVATAIGSYGNPNSPSALEFPHLFCTSHAQCRTAFGNTSMRCGDAFDFPDCVYNDCCSPFYIEQTRPDYLGAGTQHVAATDPSSSRIGIAVDPGFELQDPGTRRYVGSLVLDVPQDAIGEFTLMFRANETFVFDDGPPGSNAILPMNLVPAKVFVGVPATTEYSVKPRYFIIHPENVDSNHGYAVKLVSLHHPVRPAAGSPYPPADFTAFEGQVRWVGPVTNYTMSPSIPQHVFPASQLQCVPYFSTTWNGQPLAVFGAEVIPDSVYELKGFHPDCTDFDSCGWTVGTYRTGRWADVVPPFEGDEPGSQPNLGDVSAMLDRFRTTFGCATKSQTQLYANLPDPMRKVDFADIALSVDAFRGYAYPYPGPTSCP